jgi:hypothetical protein
MFKPRRTDDRRGGHRREYSHSSYPRDERAPRYERAPRDDRPVVTKSRYHIEEKEEPHDEPDHTDEAAIEAPIFISNESGKYEFEKWEEEGSGVEFDIKLLRGIYAYGFDSPSPIPKLNLEQVKQEHSLLRLLRLSIQLSTILKSLLFHLRESSQPRTTMSLNNLRLIWIFAHSV